MHTLQNCLRSILIYSNAAIDALTYGNYSNALKFTIFLCHFRYIHNALNILCLLLINILYRYLQHLLIAGQAQSAK